ncbi:hypothetical protein LINGRAHAP2_LOCUS1045 [Linum grandiflorum]
MVDLDNEIFLASFENPLDYDHALTGGPWMILDHYLVVHSWDPSFRASSNLPPKMVVWVRFPRLPYQYYHEDVLKGLGNLVGRTVRMDNRTLTSARGKFARLAVEINLREPVATGVLLDDVWQEVEFENLPTLCFECGRVGHEADACPSTQESLLESSQPSVPVYLIPSERRFDSNTGESTKRPEFGPWLTVERKSWKQKKGNLPSHLNSAGSGGSVPVKHSKSAISVVKGKEVATVVLSSFAPRPATDSVHKGIFNGSVTEIGEGSKEGKKRLRRRKASGMVGKEGKDVGVIKDKEAQSSKANIGPINKLKGPVQVIVQNINEPDFAVSPNRKITEPKSSQAHGQPSNEFTPEPNAANSDGSLDISAVSLSGTSAKPLSSTQTPPPSDVGNSSTNPLFLRGHGSKKKTSSAHQALRDISSTSNKPSLQLRGKKQSKKLLSAVTLTGLEAMIKDSNPAASLESLDQVAVEMEIEHSRPHDAGGFDLNTKTDEIGSIGKEGDCVIASEI